MKIIEIKPQISNFTVVNGSEAWLEVVQSARLSGVPASVSDEDCFNMIISNEYLSAVEHITLKFDLTMSKGNSPEFLEHRIGISHSGFSTRYCKAGKEDIYEIIVPFHLLKDDYLKSVFMIGVDESLNSYQRLIDEHCPREIARYILPFCSATSKYHITMNLRSLINFLSLRLCVRASPELRCLASQLYFLLEKELPIISNMIGCRGYMMSACPESNVTNVRKGEKLSCPFSNSGNKCFIPTREQRVTINYGDNQVINTVQKALYKKWASWE
jgi:thymidylate synthase (FAD)